MIKAIIDLFRTLRDLFYGDGPEDVDDPTGREDRAG